MTSLTRMRSRFFNAVEYDPETGIITKTSRAAAKLKDEIRWYLDLPAELRSLIPEVVDYSLGSKPFLRLSHVPGPTLSELYLNGEAAQPEWGAVWERIDDIFRTFARYPAGVTRHQLADMYIRKTRQRLASFLARSHWAADVHRTGRLRLNGADLPCPVRLFESGIAVFRELLTDSVPALLHGDMCFGNILYHPATRELKLIDPRGSFGKRGLYGDQRYDLAKIRHSLSGYEHISHNRFSLVLAPGQLELDIPFTPLQTSLRDEWDARLGSRLEAVRGIECLLYLSMLPLHEESSSRQLALYAVGARLLRELLPE
ncbi:aminoglycoside phosphotransferase family protein [Paenibacillus elgii]|nr:aminoglycoside phosphotransferase family protein [Paenibacillus elgii]